MSPLTLPVKCNILIENNYKNFLSNVCLKRTDKVSKLYSLIEALYINIGDPIIDWKDSAFHIKKMYNITDINGDIHEKIDYYLLDNKDEMLINIPIQTGDDIILKGEFVNKSNKPGDCVKKLFVKDIPINYFTCTDCGINWICNVCRQTCHTKHNVVLYKENHIPTWNCCYCYKRRCEMFK